MTEIQHLARLAYQNGDKQLQQGWWPYVQEKAQAAEITKEQLIDAVKSLSKQQQSNGE